jgi:hypothetical protein
MKERKELACGETVAEAKDHYRGRYGRAFDETKQEIVPDGFVFQVFNRRVKRDKTVKRSIRREGTEPYSYGKDARPIVLIVHPRELLETRLKGRRKGHVITWHDLHAMLVRRDALAAMHRKKQERKQRRLARKAARRSRFWI